MINDRAAGLWVDPKGIRPIDHDGEFFRVQGFTNQRRSPQGHPVLVQAGQSTGGRDLGATVADMIYTVQPQRDAAIEYYAAYKQNVADHGRHPDNTLILPGLVPYVGATEAEAKELQQGLVDLIDFDVARAEFASQYDVKVDDLDLEDRIPAERFEGKTDDTVSRISAFRNWAERDGLTLREILVSRFSVGGHRAVAGTASQIADTMIDWFENRACDGFSLNAPLFPDSIDQICTLLVPELQDRGYFREEYESTTFRGHLGLPIPGAWDRVPARA